MIRKIVHNPSKLLPLVFATAPLLLCWLAALILHRELAVSVSRSPSCILRLLNFYVTCA